MEYKIRFGTLAGLTPEEAFQKGNIEELVKLKNTLLKNFGDKKYEKYQKGNLEGYLAIEHVLLKNYEPLLNEFNELYAKLSEEQKVAFNKTMDKDVFYNNDIIGLQDMINNMKSEG